MLSDPICQLDDNTNLIKYKKAGTIAARVLNKLVKMSIPGTKIYDMCITGDKLIMNEVKDMYPKVRKNRKGIAFPTCVSINNIAGHYAPLETDKTIIKEGDMVKIELGVHIDGYPAIIGYTVLVNTTNKPINGPQANTISAVTYASKDILKIMIYSENF